jgi:2-iminoacetate synthase ThiH
MLIVRAFLFHNLKGEIMRTEEIIQRSLDGLELSKEEITSLFDVDPFSKESFIMQAAALEKSKKASNGLAEVHAQFGLNVGPCTLNCLFCGFAKCNGVFTECDIYYGYRTLSIRKIHRSVQGNQKGAKR